MDDLRTLLYGATESERVALAKVLDRDDSSVESICEALQLHSQSLFGVLFGEERSYRAIVSQVANRLGLHIDSATPTAAIESSIAQQVVRAMWERMTPQQRAQLEQAIAAESAKYDTIGSDFLKSGGVLAALGAAQLSGFGVYLLATTGLAATAGAVGVTLPFAVYTTMTSTIAFAIGPVGWIGAGLFAVWKLTGPDYQRLIQAILCIAAIRAAHTLPPPTPKEYAYIADGHYFDETNHCVTCAPRLHLRSGPPA
ncbi:MAG TPA: hypothetical protein VEL28_21945 [Candidatus Binatia bacterium]|nr:hypothetical protein [Candidatus Binatia bacterium]